MHSTGLVLAKAPHTKETMSDFGKIMDPNKWDSMVWYRVIQYPQVFHGLTGDQRALGFWGATTIEFIYFSFGIWRV